MVPMDRLVAFSLAAFVLIVVPGPSVLFVIGRGIAWGRRAAVATVVGNATGVYVQIVGVTAGIGAVVQRSVLAYNMLKLVGAAYLVFLGVQAIRHRRELDTAVASSGSQRRSLWRNVRDGFVVGIANPKAIVFFTAMLPQFTDPATGSVPLQMLFLGLVFVLIALVSDSAWGLAAGSARTWLARSPRRLQALGGLGGVVMIGLGLQLLIGRSSSRPG